MSLKPGLTDCFRLAFTLSHINSCNVPGTGNAKEQTWPQPEKSLLSTREVRDLNVQMLYGKCDKGHPYTQHSHLFVSLIPSDPHPPVNVAYCWVLEKKGGFLAREG